MKRILIILVLILSAGICYGQVSLNVYCTQVNEDGSTTITYETIQGSGFLEYIISAYNYDSLSYQRVGSVTDINQSVYTDHTQNANAGQVSFLITEDFGPTNRPYGSANTIYLTTTQLSETSFKLNWTSPGVISGNEGQEYKVYRRFSSQGNNWQEIYSKDTLTYTDNFPPVCHDTVSYKIELANSHGCTTVSNMRKFFVGDNQIPLEPVLLSSSVDLTTQKLNISWTPSTSPDTWGYVICSGNPSVEIDRVYGANVNSYICDICDVGQVNSIKINAFDSCNNTSLNTPIHRNIVLSYTRQACSSDIHLSWTPYVATGVNVTAYNVYMSQNGGVYSLYSTLLNGETSLLFTANPAIENYSFYIEAILSNTHTAKSNKIISSQTLPKQVDFAYIRYATVNDDNSKVELLLYIDASLPVRGYDLFRATGDGDFVLIKTISYSGVNSIIYVDTPPSLASSTIYRYKLQVPDECDLLFKTSNIASTIQLNVDASDADKNILTWNDVLGWSSVETYDIYRSDADATSAVQIGSVLSAEMGYEDNMSSMVSASDKITYYIIAREGSTPPDGASAESRSSTVSVKKESLVFIPNSFTPTDIVNKVFKPSCSFIRSGSYSFKIISRWGEVLFSTKNPSEGWDGTFKGKLCSSTSYVYFIEFINSQGEKIKKSGTVNLIN